MFAILIAAFSIFGAAFDSEMSTQEMKQTGMTKLSVQEKLVLQAWIDTHYTKKNLAQNNVKNPTMQENLKNGHYIRLSDNTLWEINPIDTPITQGWITPADIIVSQSSDPAYPYLLKNSLTGSSVKARKAESTGAASPAAPVTPSKPAKPPK